MNKNKKVLLLSFMLLSALGVIGTYINHFSNSSSNKSPNLLDSKVLAISKDSNQTVEHANIVKDINQYISLNANANVEVAVSVVDLNTNRQYDAGETGVIFKAASTVKLVTIIAYLHQVEEGKASLTQNIDGTSAQQHIKMMLEVSDNKSWASMRDFLGNDQQTYAQRIGLTSFTGYDYNTITAADEAKLLSLLHQGKLINDKHRELIYDYMSKSDFESLIKAALPADTTIYHKYGLLMGNLHDVAIISKDDHNYALVIYTKNSDNSLADYDSRVKLIHGLTQLVHNELTN